MRSASSVRVLLFGMRCGFTLPVAEALLADPGVEVAGAVVPDERPHPGAEAPPLSQPWERGTTLNRSNAAGSLGHDANQRCNRLPSSHAGRGEDSLDALLRRNRIPVIEAPSLRRCDLGPLLTRLRPAPLDAIIVACFPWRLPRWLREFPRLDALNIHPSLLPALRGPEPAFWAIRLGLRETGVTVHLMDDGFDTGPILAQRAVPIPPDITLPELETSLASTGGELACEALELLANGAVTPQSQAGMPSYAPLPGAYDFTIPTNLPAGWAARFARAVAPVYAPLPVLVMATGERLLVNSVVDATEHATQKAPVVQEDGAIVAIRFSRGIVRFRRADGSIDAGG